MRIPAFVRNLLLLIAIASPALLRAQFQEPTPEELKMTADTKAPGAAAVYLYYEEISDGPAHIGSVYERIKVLTEKGKELATVSIPYEPGIDKLTAIEGRTIHPDGTVIPLTAKPDDIMDIKTKDFQQNTLVFTLPGVEVGSILEYRVKLRRDEYWTFLPKWQIQRQYFVHKAHYSFSPNISGGFNNLMYAAHIDSDAKVVKDKKGNLTLDIADVPPEPDEDWMPPLNTLRWRVEFYYTQFISSKEFWDHARKYWATWIEIFTNPTGLLKKAATEIVAPGDTDEQKAAKIYAAVQKLDNTDFSRKKSEVERKKEKLKDIHKAEDVWKQQSGSANDIALLYVALARAAGLKVWPAYVVNRNRAMFDMSYLSDSQFDDDIVIVELGGKDVYLDPGQKMCPFGSLHWKHTLASGFRLSGKDADFATTPAGTYMNASVQRIANLSIDKTGSVQGTVRFVMTGPDALHWRQLALENDENEVKKLFNESMRDSLPEGVQADFDHFLGLDGYNSNLIGIIRVSGNLGSATGKHFFLPGLFFESRAKHPFVAQDKRLTPIDLHYAKIEQDDVTYRLPPGYTVESAPQTSDVTWPNHAVLQINSTAKDGTVEVQRTFARNFTLLNPTDYNDLRDFYLKLATADQQQLVLTRAPAAKGN
jgi:hypothetical protein